ncbi:MAG: DUF1788 domain-containing protein [Solirubrobacterales bacterium]
MSQVDDLIKAYEAFVGLPWQSGLAPAQRVWMLTYPPEMERRVRLRVKDFEIATRRAKHEWAEIDLTGKFESWMASHEYREEYFRDPELLETSLPSFVEALTQAIRGELLSAHDENGVVAVIGAGSLFGLGDEAKVSAVINNIADTVGGRLLVFFPGSHEGNSYRLLDARDGWNYLAVPISAQGGRR